MKEWLYRHVRIQLVDGDIAEQDTEAVTTAAHWRLNGGNGTDGTIHTKGGPTILAECQKIGGCPIGDAVVTSGGALQADYVIHAVGPFFNTDQDEENVKALLRSTYRNTIARATELGVSSVSIPVISTGAFAVPIRWAVPIAVGTIFDCIEEGACGPSVVRHVVYTREFSGMRDHFEAEIEGQLAARLDSLGSPPRLDRDR